MSQSFQSLGEGFQRIDATGEVREFVACLDLQQSLDATRAWKERSFAAMALQAGGSALDVGCGTGDDARRLCEIVGPRGRVVGVDKSEAMLEEARRRAPEAGLAPDFRVGEATALPFADASFDAARAERVLVHLKSDEPARAVAELSRVVRPGGRVVMTEPDMETLIVNAPDRALTRRILTSICDAHPSSWIGRQLLGLSRAAGLVELSIRAEVQVMVDAEVGRRLLPLERPVQSAEQAGLVSAEEARAWLDSVEQMARTDQYMASCTLFTVVGVRR